jgi:aryl-alcohol dehydrogenase-like predicted oxidoreductase
MRQVRLGQTGLKVSAVAFDELAREGKIRHVGVSNYGIADMEELRRFGRLETLQPAYHMFRRESEDEILPYAVKNDIGVLVYGPLAHGLLSGRMSLATAFAADDWRSKSPDFTGDTLRRNLRVVDRLKKFARARAITLPELAVAVAVADHPAVEVAIVGAHRPAQLDGTASAAGVHLAPDELVVIDGILADAVAVQGPHPEGM